MIESAPAGGKQASGGLTLIGFGWCSLRMLIATIALTGCASSVPQAVRDGPVAKIKVSEVQQAPGQCIGAQVRWGGSIIAVANHDEITQIEVLSRPLDGDGEPRADASGQGRFIAEIPGFVDPAEYQTDRLLTIVGQVSGVRTRDVGEYPYPYPYPYPVVAASSRYLWPEVEPMPYAGYRYPRCGWYGYPPWYGPLGPWYGAAYGPWWW